MINQRLKELRRTLFVPKNKKHQHYKYRTESDILLAVYPLLENDEDIEVKTHIESHGDKVYLFSEAAFKKGDDVIIHGGWAREPEEPKQMSNQQATGASTTFSRKFALQSLFMLTDDALDPDSTGMGEMPTYINDDQLNRLVDMLNLTDTDPLKLTKYYGIEKLTELPSDKFDEAMEILKRKVKDDNA